MPNISIIIPVFNEADIVVSALKHLASITDNRCEIILVDGGSKDRTKELARPYVDKLIDTHSSGRAIQMNAGAKKANGNQFLFLHCDTRLPDNFIDLILVCNSDWGFFQVNLSGRKWMFRIIESMINIRSRLTRIATGDQALFINKEVFLALGGFATIPLMEDVEICKRLRKQHKLECIKIPVLTSSRRWEKLGIWRTIFLMWRLRLSYFLGVSPNKLALKYYPNSDRRAESHPRR